MLMDATDLIGTPEYFNPSRIVHYVLELFESGDPENRARFEVAAIELDEDASPATVALTVASSDPSLESFNPPGAIEVQLRPVFFRVDTQGDLDVLPDTAEIRLLFEAAESGPGGLPLSSTSSGFVADPTSLNPGGSNNPANRDWRFVRFQARFDIAGPDTPVTLETLRPSLRFLRIPIRY
jgi:hypothetical protein